MNLEEALADIAEMLEDPSTLVRAVLSGRRRNMNPAAQRVDMRPVLLKGSLVLHVMENDGVRTTAKNYLPKELNLRELLESGYANILAESTTRSLSVRISKKGQALVHEEKKVSEQNLSHDRSKKRLLDSADPYLVKIGISDSAGKIKPSRQDKFTQVEEFLRILEPTLDSSLAAGHLPAPTMEKPLTIVDLGCGHAYLTFAAHQYLTKKTTPVHVIGIDIREDSRLRNEKIAQELQIDNTIEFQAGEISQLPPLSVDVAIALHACDTATDDALAWAVKSGAAMILAAPCCHHDIQKQMKDAPEPWGLVTRHGLLKERMGDLLTDAIRAHILRLLGYRVDTIEFVAGEHTPRNLMIRAVRTGAAPDPTEVSKYLDLIQQWHIEPALAKRLSMELSKVGVAV